MICFPDMEYQRCFSPAKGQTSHQHCFENSTDALVLKLYDEPLPPTNRWTCGTIQLYVEIHAEIHAEEDTGRRKTRLRLHVTVCVICLQRSLSSYHWTFPFWVTLWTSHLWTAKCIEKRVDSEPRDWHRYSDEVKDRIETARVIVEKNAILQQKESTARRRRVSGHPH